MSTAKTTKPKPTKSDDAPPPAQQLPTPTTSATKNAQNMLALLHRGGSVQLPSADAIDGFYSEPVRTILNEHRNLTAAAAEAQGIATALADQLTTSTDEYEAATLTALRKGTEPPVDPTPAIRAGSNAATKNLDRMGRVLKQSAYDAILYATTERRAASAAAATEVAEILGPIPGQLDEILDALDSAAEALAVEAWVNSPRSHPAPLGVVPGSAELQRAIDTIRRAIASREA